MTESHHLHSLKPPDAHSIIEVVFADRLICCCLRSCNQDEEGRGAAVFFHSAAHVLGQALERTLGGQLTVGPALKEGFYYDCYMGQDTITEDKTYGPLQKCISAVVKVSSVENAGQCDCCIVPALPFLPERFYTSMFRAGSYLAHIPFGRTFPCRALLPIESNGTWPTCADLNPPRSNALCLWRAGDAF